MAVTSVTLSCETSAGSIERLQLGIDARAKALGKCTGDSTVAAGITILRSLRAATAKVPTGKKAVVDAAAYRIVATDMYGGLYFDKGTKPDKLGPVLPHGGRRAIMKGANVCARIGSHYGPRANIRPAVGFKPGTGAVFKSRVFAIYTDNPHDRFEKNVNRPAMCWYVLCEHEGQAVAYAENHIRRIYSKESGMAKYAIAIAQAKASTRSRYLTRDEAIGNGGMSQKAAGISYDAAEISIDDSGYADGVVSVTFLDGLNYSTSAAGGEGALSAAIDKASDAMVMAYGAPEVKKALQDFRQCEKIHSDLAAIFRTHWIARNSGSDKLSKRTPF